MDSRLGDCRNAAEFIHSIELADLIQLLPDSREEVTSVAARALGECGSIHAVEALLECERHSRNGGRRLACESAAQAVRAIQARAEGASRGEISIAPVGEESGSLSLAATPGELSIAERAPPRKDADEPA